VALRFINVAPEFRGNNNDGVELCFISCRLYLTGRVIIEEVTGMRIVVLGGAGDMGAEAVRDLVRYSKATEIVIADMNEQKSKQLAESIGDERLKVKKLDARSHENLVEIMKGSAAVAGALGPFYLFERLIIEAAIEAGANYVSICDDHDAVEAALTLDQEARQKGRRIMTGLGWTPGLSNLLARRGYDRLDQAESVRIYWAGSVGDSKGMAVILHLIHIFGGRVVSYQDGETVRIKAGSEKETVRFPAPLDHINTYHLGHPEPITVPLYLEGLQNVILKGGMVEHYLNLMAKCVAALGLAKYRLTKQILGRILKFLTPIFPANKKRSLSGIRVDISGYREGKPVVLSYGAAAPMRKLTGLPLSIGAMMMAESKIKRYGVFGPEADSAVDCELFLEELRRRGIEIVEREF